MWETKIEYITIPDRRCAHCSCIRVSCCVCGKAKPGITPKMQEDAERELNKLMNHEYNIWDFIKSWF